MYQRIGVDAFHGGGAGVASCRIKIDPMENLGTGINERWAQAFTRPERRVMHCLKELVRIAAGFAESLMQPSFYTL
ncbi:hypothetical protein GCM10027180_17360 [Microbulbifer echini]